MKSTIFLENNAEYLGLYMNYFFKCIERANNTIQMSYAELYNWKNFMFSTLILQYVIILFCPLTYHPSKQHNFQKKYTTHIHTLTKPKQRNVNKKNVKVLYLHNWWMRTTATNWVTIGKLHCKTKILQFLQRLLCAFWMYVISSVYKKKEKPFLVLFRFLY